MLLLQQSALYIRGLHRPIASHHCVVNSSQRIWRFVSGSCRLKGEMGNFPLPVHQIERSSIKDPGSNRFWGIFFSQIKPLKAALKGFQMVTLIQSQVATQAREDSQD